MWKQAESKSEQSTIQNMERIKMLHEGMRQQKLRNVNGEQGKRKMGGRKGDGRTTGWQEDDMI